MPVQTEIFRAIVVRHFKTVNNVSNEILGWGDAPRVENWQEDLAYVDTIIVEKNLQFSALYTSCLERSRQTGSYYSNKHAIPLAYDTEALNEVNYGSLFNKNKSWVEQHIPQHKTDPDYVYPKGESFHQMQARSVEFFKSLIGKHQGQTVLVVTHAGVIRGVVSYFLGLPYTENLKRDISHRYIGDFQLLNGQCLRYDELGIASGFIKGGRNTIKTPWTNSGYSTI